MNRLTLLIVAIVTTVWACKTENASEANRVKSENGFEYILHSNSTATKPQPKEFVFFHVQTRKGEEIVAKTREHGGQIPRMMIPDVEDANTASPILEVLKQMSVGDSATVFQSLDSMPTKPIGFEDVNEIAYDIVVIDIQDETTYQESVKKEQEALQKEREGIQAREAEISTFVADIAKKYGAGQLDGDIQTTDSGLKYIVHEAGTGKDVEAGNVVAVQYDGVLTDGTMFDNSFQRGVAFNFPVGQGRVIQGWDEGIDLLKEGSKATLFVPYELGYGEAGSPPAIPEKAELIFYVEVEKAQ